VPKNRLVKKLISKKETDHGIRNAVKLKNQTFGFGSFFFVYIFSENEE
jgi:hypothetical protein